MAEEKNINPEEEEILEQATEQAQTENEACDANEQEPIEEQTQDASTEEESPEEAQDAPTKEKKSFFGRKDKAKDKDKEKIAELEDRVLRQMAEFENFRRRTEKEKQQMFETGAKSVIEKILPVVDNFERGLASIPDAEAEGAVAAGMQMIYKQLIAELDKIGVKPIEAVGCEFDPNKHNAVMQMASEDVESGMVAAELQKGYTYRDSVVRHSMVAVAE